MPWAVSTCLLTLSSEAGAADVTATMQAVAPALGMRQSEVDITFTSLSMTYQERPEDWPLVATRQVRSRVIDYLDLTRVDHLVRDVLRGNVGLGEARTLLEHLLILATDAPQLKRGRWMRRLGEASYALGDVAGLATHSRRALVELGRTRS